MPWQKESVMMKKRNFIEEVLRRENTFAAICDKYNISRRVGYKYVHRFLQFGMPGLEEISKKPHIAPHQLSEDMVCKIIRIKNNKPAWGPKKVRAIFHTEFPTSYLPSTSTFERVLKKAGLTTPRKRKRNPSGLRIVSKCNVTQPNDLWTVDFKGYWYTTKREKVIPLTIRDEYSKFILAVEVVVKGDGATVKRVFERIFKIYGLPKVIKSDNGPPFANVNNSLGLTKLSVWWMSLGIKLHRIKPASPYQNGGHERMHLDIAKEVECRNLNSIESYQLLLDKWKLEFNKERPHEALKMKTPSQVYIKSTVPFHNNLADFTYPKDYVLRKVSSKGNINLDSRRYTIGNPFYGYLLGIDQKGRKKNENLHIYFGESLLGYLDENSLQLVPIIMSSEFETKHNLLPMS